MYPRLSSSGVALGREISHATPVQVGLSFTLLLCISSMSTYYYRRRLPPPTESFIAETVSPGTKPKDRHNPSRVEEEAIWLFPAPSTSINPLHDEQLLGSLSNSTFTVPTSIATSFADRSPGHTHSDTERSRSRDSRGFKEWEPIDSDLQDSSDHESLNDGVQLNSGDLLEGRVSGWEWTLDHEESAPSIGYATDEHHSSQLKPITARPGHYRGQISLPSIQEHGISFRLSSPTESLKLSQTKVLPLHPNACTFPTNHPFTAAIFRLLQKVLFIDQSTIDLLLGEEESTSSIFSADKEASFALQRPQTEEKRPWVPSSLLWNAPQVVDRTLRQGIHAMD